MVNLLGVGRTGGWRIHRKCDGSGAARCLSRGCLVAFFALRHVQRTFLATTGEQADAQGACQTSKKSADAR